MVASICCMGASHSSCQNGTEVRKEEKAEVLYVMPAESEPHEGTWLQWPHAYEYGKEHRDRIEGMWVDMAREIVSGEKLHIIAYNERERERITGLLTKEAIPMDRVDFLILKTNDVWVRDNGPIYVRDKAGRQFIEGWGFNGWGDKTTYQFDQHIPQAIANERKAPFIPLHDQFTVEGGAIELDGKGAFLATRSSVLNSNRNKGITEQEAEKILTKYLGVTHFIWLDGVAGLEITDMHIDGLARFADPNTLITMSPDDLHELGLPDHDIETLYQARTPQGEPYRYVVLPITQHVVTTTYGEKVPFNGSYANYYITNDKVLVPNYNDPNDAKANAILQSVYPTRTVVGIDARNVYANGGMIHCVTQQQPLR